MTTHTPGPWRMGAGNFGRILAGNLTIADTKTHDSFGECEELANAQLIASAPELLEALEFALRYLDHPDVQAIGFSLSAATAAKRLRATIAKAKGETP